MEDEIVSRHEKMNISLKKESFRIFMNSKTLHFSYFVVVR